jgi:hypothetical protein
LAGVMAGAGFAIKPYFLFPLILIELYCIYRKKNIFGWVRVESLAILAILIIYLATTYYYHINYFNVILPLLDRFYFGSIIEPWWYIFSVPAVLFCLLSLFFGIIFKNHIETGTIFYILMLTTLGCVLSFIVTRTTWFYHLIPAIGFSMISFVFLLFQFHGYFKDNSIIFASIIVFVLTVPAQNIVSNTYSQYHDRQESSYKIILALVKSQNQNRSIMCFSANTTADCFPLVNEAQARYASRYPFFWWMRGVDMHDRSKSNKIRSDLQYKNYLINAIADDLDMAKPAFVLINVEASNIIFGEKFSYIEYFSHNQKFRHAWNNYRMLAVFGRYSVYKRSA